MKLATSLSFLAVVARALAVTSPANDPFYAAPSNLTSYQPGDIIRHRPIPSAPVGLTNLQATYQILYRTTDTLGEPEAAVTTILVPNNADPSKLLSYQIAEDAAAVQCAPSVAIQEPSFDTSYQTLLNDGVYVNIPDYEGPDSEFSAGVQEGQATLDSIRAILKSSDLTGINSDANVAMWGYSGGSIASGWAAQLQATYAPDLNPRIKGVAVGGFVTNLTATALLVDKTVYTGFLPAALLSLATAYDLNDLINEELIASTADLFKQARQQCMIADLAQFAGQDIFSYFKDGEAAIYLPQVQAALQALTMGKVAPLAPLFVYQGVQDQIAPVGSVDETVSSYCKLGGTVTYYKDPDTDHIGTATNGAADALEFVADVLAGHPAVPGCNTLMTVLGSSQPGTTIVNTNFPPESTSAVATATSGATAGASAVASGSQITSAPASASAAATSGAGSFSNGTSVYVITTTDETGQTKTITVTDCSCTMNKTHSVTTSVAPVETSSPIKYITTTDSITGETVTVEDCSCTMSKTSPGASAAPTGTGAGSKPTGGSGASGSAPAQASAPAESSAPVEQSNSGLALMAPLGLSILAAGALLL